MTRTKHSDVGGASADQLWCPSMQRTNCEQALSIEWIAVHKVESVTGHFCTITGANSVQLGEHH